MSAKHTPGPWQVHGSHIYTADPERAMLAQVFNPGSKASDFPLVANASLIAAAPGMLAILRSLLHSPEFSTLTLQQRVSIVEAIERATKVTP